MDKVRRDPASGIDWDRPRYLRDYWQVSAVKLVGLWATWGVVAAMLNLRSLMRVAIAKRLL